MSKGIILGVALAAALAISLLAVDWRAEQSEAVHGVPLLPHATIRIWDTLPVLGSDPDESVEDPAALTGHVGMPTIVTVYENTTHFEGPCGISFWNPVTNSFKWYGITGGFQTGVDLNRSGPVEAGPGAVTFRPGDTWASGQMSVPLYMNFMGSNNFRFYTALDPSFPSDAWGVEVDEATGDVWFTQPSSGFLSRLDPTTNLITRWAVGGAPAYVTLDSAGRPYATLSSTDQIVRLNPGIDASLGTPDDTATYWAVPGLADFIAVPGPFETPDGITIDSAGNIWFDESSSDQIGRLNPVTNDITEYTKPGLDNPQLIATSGAGGLLQGYFTEGLGDAISILTQVEADNLANPGRLNTSVTPTTSAVAPATLTPTVTDSVRTPLTATIVPTVHDVEGLDGFASGTTKTAGPDGTPGNADDETIPAIVRFPTGPIGGTFPSGMTGVYAANRIAGAFLGSDKHFELESRAVIAPPVSPTPTRTPVPTPPPPVGGISQDPEPGVLPLDAPAGSSGPSAGLLAGVIAAGAAGAVALGGGVWYARRRSVR